MNAKTTLPIAAVLLLMSASAFAQIQVIPMGAAGTAPRQMTAEAAPAAPTNLQAFAVSGNQVNLTWQDNSADETQFRLEIRTASTSFQDVGTAIPANVEGAQVHGLSPSTTYFFRIKARNASGDSVYSNEVSVTTLADGGGTCVHTGTAMCLNNDRFRVQATYQTGSGLAGQARTVKLTDDSGYLWFFGPENIEVVVKVLNGCAINDHYWVFAGGLTDVRVVLVVTDTKTGATTSYTNTLGRAFQPIQDTSALESCP